MILHLFVRISILWRSEDHFRKHKKTYHKFVKTTPKPNATKNNNGELVGPPPPPPPLDGVAVGEDEVTTCEEEAGSDPKKDRLRLVAQAEERK